MPSPKTAAVCLPHRSLPALLIVMVLCSVGANSQDVLTYHNNNSRNGLDNKVTALTTGK